MQFPKEALEILQRLEDHGWEAWLVGGAVRDALFSHPLHDIDIASSATPDQIIHCFSDCKTLTVGKAFGTVRVLYGKGEYEITSYRSESGYADKRHPDQVHFSDKIEEDLMRRDFTMNAMAYHPQRGLLDLFGGKKDYENGILRAVGKADQRIDEDGLRMLRACRFAARFSLKMDPALLAAIQNHASEIDSVSMERCLDEMTRMLTGPNPGMAIALLQETGLYEVLFPEWGKIQEIEKTRIESLPADPILRWAGFFSAIEKSPPKNSATRAKETLRRWKASRKLQDHVALLLREDQAPLPQNLEEAIYWKGRIGPMAEDLLVFRQAKALQRAPEKEAGSQPQPLDREGQEIQRTRLLLKEIQEKALPTAIKDLALSGADLKEAGWREGLELGKILQGLFALVAAGKIPNQKEALLQKAREWKSKKP